MRVAEQIVLLGVQSSANGGGGPVNAETTAWINAVVVAGGAVSATQSGRVDALITALKGHSLFSANSRLWLHAGESDSRQATIDIMGLATATPVNSPTLAAAGYTGNGSTSYVSLGTRPSNYAQDSGSFGCYSITNSTTQDDSCPIGANDTTSCIADLLSLRSGGNALCRVNRGGGNSIGAANPNRRGLYIAVSASSTSQILYKNGSSFASGIQASQSFAALPGFFICARNDNGVSALPAVDQIAASYILVGLDATQAGNFSTDLNAYMTAWGINVY